jgi:hypothetical protein
MINSSEICAGLTPTMRDPEKLKLGKGMAFVKSHIRCLPQSDMVWEVDFLPAPEQDCQRMGLDELWLGLVVAQDAGSHLSYSIFDVSPTVNDLAKLLGEAMRRPLVESASRPLRIHVRDKAQWHQLLPHLTQLRIEVDTREALPVWDQASSDFFTRMRESPLPRVSLSESMLTDVERHLPTLTRWVQAHGRIEIGLASGDGLVARVLDSDGIVFEDRQSKTLRRALIALEQGIAVLSR